MEQRGVSTQGLFQRDRASLWFNDIWKGQEKGQDASIQRSSGFVPTSQDEHRIRLCLFFSLSLSFFLFLSLSPDFTRSSTCPSLLSGSFFSLCPRIGKPVQKVASKKWNRARRTAICRRTIEGQCISEHGRATEHRSSFKQPDAMYWVRWFSLKQFTFRLPWIADLLIDIDRYVRTRVIHVKLATYDLEIVTVDCIMFFQGYSVMRLESFG